MCAYLMTICRFHLNFFIQNCFLGDEYKQIFDSYLSSDLANGTIVGFSDLRNATDLQRSHEYIFQTVYKYAKRYKTIEQAKKTGQHEVIFDTVDQRYYIDVLHNKTLEKENHQAWKNNSASASPPLAKNILIIFIDSVSRFQTHLKLPKYSNWFKKQTRYKSYQKNEPHNSNEAKRQAYEFYKYHSVGPYTEANLYPIFYGHKFFEMVVQPKRDRYKSVHQPYK